MPSQRRLYPPVYLLLGLALIVLLHLLLPLMEIVPRPLSGPGAVLFILGAAPAILVNQRFSQAGTTIVPLEVSKTLVTDGLFRYSRNPIYLGMTVSLLGAALFLGSLSPFVIAPLFIRIIQTRFIVHEERILVETFGEEYRAYKAKVRRWL